MHVSIPRTMNITPQRKVDLADIIKYQDREIIADY